MRTNWSLAVLDLPKFGPEYVWLAVSRRDPQDLLLRYSRLPTPDGITVTAGGGVLSMLHPPLVGLTRKEAEEACDELGVELLAQGKRVLSDAGRMARIRRRADRRDGRP